MPGRLIQLYLITHDLFMLLHVVVRLKSIIALTAAVSAKCGLLLAIRYELLGLHEFSWRAELHACLVGGLADHECRDLVHLTQLALLLITQFLLHAGDLSFVVMIYLRLRFVSYSRFFVRAMQAIAHLLPDLKALSTVPVSECTWIVKCYDRVRLTSFRVARLSTTRVICSMAFVLLTALFRSSCGLITAWRAFLGLARPDRLGFTASMV